MTDEEPQQASPACAKTGRRSWPWLVAGAGLGLLCCCGVGFSWIPLSAIGVRQVVAFRATLKPGMSTRELLRAVDGVSRSRFGMSLIFGWPKAAPTPATGGDQAEDSCPVTTHLTWAHGSDAPWGRGEVPAFEEVASRLSACGAIEFFSPVYFLRCDFVVRLNDGRVSEVGPLQCTWT